MIVLQWYICLLIALFIIARTMKTKDAEDNYPFIRPSLLKRMWMFATCPFAICVLLLHVFNGSVRSSDDVAPIFALMYNLKFKNGE